MPNVKIEKTIEFCSNKSITIIDLEGLFMIFFYNGPDEHWKIIKRIFLERDKESAQKEITRLKREYSSRFKGKEKPYESSQIVEMCNLYQMIVNDIPYKCTIRKD